MPKSIKKLGQASAWEPGGGVQAPGTAEARQRFWNLGSWNLEIRFTGWNDANLNPAWHELGSAVGKHGEVLAVSLTPVSPQCRGQQFGFSGQCWCH